jgi:hypothetical protein
MNEDGKTFKKSREGGEDELVWRLSFWLLRTLDVEDFHDYFGHKIACGQEIRNTG